MMKLYNIIFFQLYKSLLKSGERDIPVFVAIVLINLLISFNLLTLLSIIRFFLQDSILLFTKLEILLVYFILLSQNLLYFLRKKKYKSIIKNLNQVDENIKRKRVLYFWIYAIGTHIAFFVSASL